MINLSWKGTGCLFDTRGHRVPHHGANFPVLAEGIGIEPIGLKERFAANILKSGVVAAWTARISSIAGAFYIRRNDITWKRCEESNFLPWVKARYLYHLISPPYNWLGCSESNTRNPGQSRIAVPTVTPINKQNAFLRQKMA